MINVVIAEDHKLVRHGLTLLLNGDSGIRLVGEAEDGLNAIQLVEKLRPQILLLDLSLPKLHGIEVAFHLREQSHTRIIIVSVHADEFFVTEALTLGVAGYVPKAAPAPELLQAIHEVSESGHFVSPDLRKAVLNFSLKRISKLANDPLSTLSSRERRTLELGAQGRKSSEIGRELNISPRTVEMHRRNMMSKLSLHSQTEIVRYAVRKGLIEA
jgi:DNA-binding NarL/FixJ family response regulator